MNTGACRAGAITGIFNFVGGPYSCFDAWQGLAAGGVNYTSAYGGQPNRARLRGVAAIPGSTAVTAGVELYVFAFALGYQKTVGAGACDGCTNSACLFLTSVQLTQPPGVGDYIITNSLQREYVFWRCPNPGYSYCAPLCTVPTREASWGVIKTLYR